jgi:ElaB/YqjD/DUF883 family membrane-anchored ribosome-binding protein
MEKHSQAVDQNAQSIDHSEKSKKNCGIDQVQNLLAEKLENIAGTIRQKTASHDEQSEMTSYGEEASQILHQSADYIRRFEYEKAETDVQKFIKEQPGKSLLLAGGAGLLLGLFLRRK